MTTAMTSDDVLDEFRGAGALREGHFVLSSGLHSPVFLQKNLVFMDARRCERLCKALAEKITATVGKVDVAISPAVGGIIPGYETARWLGVPSMYVEREGAKGEDSYVLCEINVSSVSAAFSAPDSR